MKPTHAYAIFSAVLALIVWSAGVARGAAPISAEDRDRLVELVERSTRFEPRSPQPDVLIGGLRMLRDPALHPLFERLTLSDVPGLRMHGILGLAELDERRGLAPSLLALVENPLEQTSIFSQAARAGLVNEHNLSQILAWTDIGPDLEAAALQRGLSLGLEIDVERARRLAGDESVAVAIMGGLILLELGRGADEAGEAMDRFFSLPVDVRRSIAGMLLQHIRRESLQRAAPFVERVAEDARAGGDELLRIEAAHTLLQTDPSRGMALWMSLYDASADLATRLMLAIAALESPEPGLAPLFERLEAEAENAPLLADMGRAGLALGAGAGRAEALVALAGHAHGPACQWIVGAVEDLPERVATPALRAVIRAAAEAGDRRADVRSAAISAAAQLAERAPEALAAALGEMTAARNESMCQALLVGALRSRASEAVFLPGADARWPGRQSAALADLAAARFGDTASPAHLENLNAIALGRASLPEVFRVQAAWLALRGIGEEQAALQ